MKTNIFKLLFFYLLSCQLYAQELLPFVENFSKSHYQGDNQIWSIAQGNDRVMYFANNYYLLRYDGVVWEKNPLPNKTIIRSILVDGDKIYCGSYKEFGYWYRKNSKMFYVSLTKGKNIFKDSNNDEIWKIFKFKGNIYFQSFNGVFILNSKNQVKEIKFPFMVSYCFVLDNEIIVAAVDKGVYVLENQKFIKINNTSLLEHNVIHSVQKYKDVTYFFTKKNGVFVMNNGVLVPWNHPLNTILKRANINVAKFINDKLVVGTANEGLYVLEFSNNVYFNINRTNVLMNNSVLTINIDKENDLWLGLDNGIAHVEINSSISIFYDNSGKVGSVYSVASIPNGYLMASNHGIYKYENKKLNLIPNTQGQAWNITKIDENYLIGHDEGTFNYKEGVLKKLNNVNGGWNITRSSINNNFFQASYSGITVYNNPKDLTTHFSIKGFYNPIKYISQNKKNEIWAADNNRGLFRIIYDDINNLKKVENITQLSKISNDFGVKILQFRGETLFLINQIWYTYNSIKNQLVKDDLFNANLKSITNVAGIDDNHFVVLKNGLLYYVYVQKNRFHRYVIQEKYYKGKVINDNLKVYKNGKDYLINLDDGFIKLQFEKNKKQLSNLKIEAYSQGQPLGNKAVIEYNAEIKLRVITGTYGSNKTNLFYKINSSSEFSTLKEGLITLDNLDSGNYEVAIYTNNGLTYKKVADYNFRVAYPWYLSFWMICLYLLGLSGVLHLYYRWNKMRYKQKLALREEELKHQKKILEMELKAESELLSQEYEKHILELELKAKSSQVTVKSLSIAKQSEMIENIKAILDTETDLNKLRSEINKAIKINAINKNEWESFETNLNQIHNEFITKLSKKFPNLTAKDIKLCIYLKMNLSSKEIAPMINISFRGVELHRYQLRKKLMLSQEENLSNFLLSI